MNKNCSENPIQQRKTILLPFGIRKTGWARHWVLLFFPESLGEKNMVDGG